MTVSAIAALLLSRLGLCEPEPSTIPERNLHAEAIAQAAGISVRQADAITNAVADMFARR